MSAFNDTKPDIEAKDSELPTPHDHGREATEQQLRELVSGLKQTRDAVDPVVRMDNDRKHVSSIAGALAKSNLLTHWMLAGSIGLNLFLGWYAVHPDRQYFAADHGRIFPMVPLSQPYRKASDVIQFARDNLNRSMTINFQQYRQQLEDARGYWTTQGFKVFLEQIQKAGYLEMVKTKRMNMTITAGTGVITKSGVQDGIAFWDVEMPIDVKLVGQTTEQPTQTFIAKLHVTRVDTLDSIEGIGLDGIVTVPR